MTITRINEYQAAENKADILYEFLSSLVPYITSSEGCRSCELLRNKELDNHFVTVEKWESQDAHKKAVLSFPKEIMLSAEPLFAEPPRGGYFDE